METQAKQRYIRMPARKLRRVINEVRGKSVVDAMNMLKFMPYFAAKIVAKNIKCAAANAQEKWGTDTNELIVSEIFADDGPTYKRAKPRAQGRVYRIEKRTSHLTVLVKVSEELLKKQEEKKKAKKVKTKKAEAKPVKEVKIEEKPAEVIEEAKNELDQGITPSEVGIQPETATNIEADVEKTETKNIKPEVVQQESTVVEESAEPEVKAEAEEPAAEESKEEVTEEESKQED